MTLRRDILDDIDVHDWLDEYVTIRSTNSDEIVLEVCPSCGRDDYKLYVNTANKRFICHGCGFGTGVNDISVLFAEVAGKSLAAIHAELEKIVMPAPAGDLASKLKDIFYPNKPAAPVRAGLVSTELPGEEQFTGIVAGQVLDYARNRGLSLSEVQQYQLRAAWKLNAFSGPFLLFPIIYKDTPVGWQGRRVVSIEPKYVSCGEIANWLWPLQQVYLARISSSSRVVLVEGVFDAIAFWRMGVPALCTFGKKISDAQVALLVDMGISSVVLAWDADAIKEIKNAALRLQSAFAVAVIDFSVRPSGFDAVKKVDAGDALKHLELQSWVQERLNGAIGVDSSEFFNWRLAQSLK